ncbi:MAG: phosphate acyltransferase PlsX [Rubrobacter sp.]|nr:phosphate acyltransferase PlsX [Rubrobacter sp.]MBA3951640.1 phosphate acyltransferase PlsX [Rubrobacter sp.]MDQ3363328.1 phosphate acyltransferase PlsX [Actinomycetota bacterium]
MRLAVDALGGDNAPGEVVAGALAAARRLPGDEIFLVGPGAEIEPHLGSDLPANVSVRPSGGPVGMEEEPAAALRKRPDAGVSAAAKMVRAGEADAFFSAGNTGATVAAALMRIGRMDGVRRPGIATVLPLRSPVLLLDAGATTMCRPQDLLNFAILGGVFAERYFGLGERARVGLVNVGEEPGKGTDLAKEAHGLIARSGVRFVGNVEGRDVGTGVADVLVTDGFTGNVMLKTAEGVAREVLGMFRSAVTGDLVGKLAGAALKSRLVGIRDQVDPENYGGSFLLGVRGPVMIGHGNSRARGVENALVGISRSGEGLIEALGEALDAARTSGEAV